jgi:Mg-chelatase subunit ChlD|tara:strand:- start:11 stop:199 length:189 start_codon:yes stop_codon:yes gene_type:complete
MAYNILKEMKDQKTGKPTYVLLTDGLSQIWEVKTEKEATKIVKMLNENSDSGWNYKIRKNCK